MRFQFDPAKAAENQRKHGISFADAEGVFTDPLAIHCPDPDSEAEERFIGIGLGSAGRRSSNVPFYVQKRLLNKAWAVMV
jgi:uncharacterized DUF497 family protein